MMMMKKKKDEALKDWQIPSPAGKLAFWSNIPFASLTKWTEPKRTVFATHICFSQSVSNHVHDQPQIPKQIMPDRYDSDEACRKEGMDDDDIGWDEPRSDVASNANQADYSYWCCWAQETSSRLVDELA